jgi:hypothetical protein
MPSDLHMVVGHSLRFEKHGNVGWLRGAIVDNARSDNLGVLRRDRRVPEQEELIEGRHFSDDHVRRAEVRDRQWLRRRRDWQHQNQCHCPASFSPYHVGQTGASQNSSSESQKKGISVAMPVEMSAVPCANIITVRAAIEVGGQLPGAGVARGLKQVRPPLVPAGTCTPPISPGKNTSGFE